MNYCIVVCTFKGNIFDESVNEHFISEIEQKAVDRIGTFVKNKTRTKK